MNRAVDLSTSSYCYVVVVCVCVCVCGIRRSQETLDLSPKSYASVADDGVSVTGVRVSITSNTSEGALFRCPPVFFTCGMLFTGGKPSFLLPVAPDLISSVCDRWRPLLVSRYPYKSPSCPFCRCH